MPVFERIIAANGVLTNIRHPRAEAVVDFSNSGRRGGYAWFTISGSQLRRTLADIRENHARFPPDYNEAAWREAFNRYLQNDVARTMGSVQTLPFFELLAKIIHYSNSAEDRDEKTINLDPDAITNAIARIDEHFDALQAAGPDEEQEQEQEQEQDEVERLVGGRNLIIYGAPGTGKSHKVDGLVAGGNSVRTVFHSDTQNSDFFGSLKPRTHNDRIRYEFAPGPFMISVRSALLDAGNQHFLVIEELNRAPAAAVFGELFQLLDREEDGTGTYEVDFPNPESLAWMRSDRGPQLDRLRMPSNLTIVATMNSADQGVYPLDTAFRRRWMQEYMPLEGENAPDGRVTYVDASNVRKSVLWRDFVRTLNSWLTEKLEVPEDRLLGQWFVKSSELGERVPAKILLYLWDDLLRHGGRDTIFAQNLRTYGQLDRAASGGAPVFSAAFIDILDAESITDMPAADGAEDAVGQ